MSDPVSNAEIEDVLSSIRRLVSVDSRGAAKLGVELERQDQVSHDDDTDIANDAPLEEVDNSDVPEVSGQADEEHDAGPRVQGLELGTTGAKLVLTQALRVSEAADGKDTPEDEEQSAVEPEAELSDEDPVEESAHADEELDDTDTHVSLGEGDDPLRAPEEGSDFVRLRPEVKAKDWIMGAVGGSSMPIDSHADDEEWPEEDLKDDTSDMELAPPPEEETAEEWTEEDLQDDPEEANLEVAPKTSGNELEARIAEVEAAVAARGDQWDPDAADQDDYAGGTVEPLNWEDHGEDDAAEADAEPVEEISPEEVDEIEEAVLLDEQTEIQPDELSFIPQSSDPVSGPAAATEVASVADTETPEEQTQDLADSPEPLNLSDVAITDEVTEILSEEATASAAEAAADAAWYSEDTVIDESALRDLVGEIVRQELQGALGERITRNVRKLVRREIHRAMMGQDYD